MRKDHEQPKKDKKLSQISGHIGKTVCFSCFKNGKSIAACKALWPRAIESRNHRESLQEVEHAYHCTMESSLFLK